MDAVITAGGIPQAEDPLYTYTQGAPKALVDICGKPMVQWVLDALSGAEMVEDVVVIGLEAGSGLTSPKIKAFLPNQGDMIANIRGGVGKIMELKPDTRHVLMVSSDIPGIKPEMVDWVVKAALESDEDLYYYVVERRVMEARYPGSRRSFTRLQDVEVCGGDMNVIRAALVTQNREIWDKLIASRKNVFKQAALIGYDTLVLLLLRKITLQKAVATVARRLNVTGRAILCPYAEVGMDVDKPHQLEIMRADMARLK